MVAAAAMSLSVPAWAADDPRVAAEIMALARAQWAAEIAGQPVAQQMSSLADDYTEYNGDYPTRIDGKAMAVAMSAITAEHQERLWRHAEPQGPGVWRHRHSDL